MADELLPFIFRRDLDRPLISNELDGNNDAIEQRYELAVEARTDAEQARDDAQQIADNIDVREWLTGSTAPVPELGADGDMYMSGDGSVWKKQSGTWVQTDVNVAGPEGPMGPEGPEGLKGETGEGLAIIGELPSVGDLPLSGGIGDAYVIDGIIYIWSATTSSWVDIGRAGSGFDPVTVTTANKTLAAGECTTVTTAGQTITLPASPIAGDRVGIGVLAFTDTIIDRNDSNIMGLAENMTIDTENVTVTLLYVDASNGWRII